MLLSLLKNEIRLERQNNSFVNFHDQLASTMVASKQGSNKPTVTPHNKVLNMLDPNLIRQHAKIFISQFTSSLFNPPNHSFNLPNQSFNPKNQSFNLLNQAFIPQQTSNNLEFVGNTMNQGVLNLTSVHNIKLSINQLQY